MQEVCPTTTQKILKSHAEIVFQNPVIDIGEFAIGSARPEEGGHRFDDLTELVFAFSQRILSALAVRQIEYERDALVAALFEQRASNQHGDTAAILSEKLFLVRLSNSI